LFFLDRNFVLVARYSAMAKPGAVGAMVGHSVSFVR
jgi:hypothetical protein